MSKISVEKLAEIFNWFAWAPLAGPVISEQCRARIYVQHRFTAIQCSRKGSVTIKGFRFCTQHAKKMNERIKRALEGHVK